MFINVAIETVTEMTITFWLSFDEFNFEWTHEQFVSVVATIVFVSLFLSAFVDVAVDVVLTVVAVVVVLSLVAFVVNLFIGSWTKQKVEGFNWTI